MRPMQAKNEAIMLVPAFVALVIFLVRGLSNFLTTDKIWDLLHKCEVYNCDAISIIASIVGTCFVVITLVFAIRSSNRRDKQNQEQINLMNGQIQLLTQNNRMNILREYMIALSRKIYGHIADGLDVGGGLLTIEDKNGIIFGWNLISDDIMLDYRFCVVLRLFSSKLESAEKILEEPLWWHISIDVIRSKSGGYGMTGYANNEGSYLPIERVFCDMSDDDYNVTIMAILSLTSANKDILIECRKRKKTKLRERGDE